MTTLNKTIAFAALAASLLVAGTAMARDIRPNVPGPPGGGGGGYGPQCVTGNVYGYTLRICNNNYRVFGGGLICNGSLKHSGQSSVNVTLRRGSCTSGTEWSADSIRCAGNGAGGSPAGRLQGATCTYFPNAAGRAEGYKSTSVYFN